MTNDDNNDNDTKSEFQKAGLDIGHKPTSELEIGTNYPLYGMITKFISEDPEDLRVELNFNTLLRMTGLSPEKLELLRARAFEPGIFVATIDVVNQTDDFSTTEGYGIHASCSTVVFGKSQDKGMN